MIASGLMPRSPVWLRKIPSTVSGSQGSRRGLRPAVRFAFPLGARLNTTLRARPCQELFSESFSGRPAGRGAPRLPGFGPSRRRVRYYTRPRRGAGGKPARTQDADNSSAAERRSLVRLRQTSNEANTSRAARSRLQRRCPPERRTAASGPARLPRGQSPRRPSLVDSLCRKVSIISILKKLRRDRLFECSSISTASDPTHVCRSAPGTVLKPKRRELPMQPSS